MDFLYKTLISFLGGAAAFLVIEFLAKPYIHARRCRIEVRQALVNYANVPVHSEIKNLEDRDSRQVERYLEAQKEFRRLGVEFDTLVEFHPYLVKLFDKIHGTRLSNAKTSAIGYSNSLHAFEGDGDSPRYKAGLRLRKALNLRDDE